MIRRADKGVEALEREIAELERQSGKPTENTEAINEIAEPTKAVTETETQADDELSVEEKTFKKRYGDLRRHSQEKERNLQSQIDELKQKLSERAPSFPTDKEKVKEWAANNPNAAAIIRAIVEEETDAKGNEIKSKIVELEEMNKTLSRKEAETRVKEAHTDFNKIINSSKFHDWAEAQPEWIQDKIYDNMNAEDTIWAISLYKRENGIKTTDRSAAESVGGNSRTSVATDQKGRFTESKVLKMSLEEYEANEDQIMKDMKSPSFYDLSGGAR